jgi:hypothetical protein
VVVVVVDFGVLLREFVGFLSGSLPTVGWLCVLALGAITLGGIESGLGNRGPSILGVELGFGSLDFPLELVGLFPLWGTVLSSFGELVLVSRFPGSGLLSLSCSSWYWISSCCSFSSMYSIYSWSTLS